MAIEYEKYILKTDDHNFVHMSINMYNTSVLKENSIFLICGKLV